MSQAVFQFNTNKPKWITDEMIVEQFNSGRLRIENADSRDPVLIGPRGRPKTPYIVKGSNPNGIGRYCYKIKANGHERSILRTKVVFMGVKRRVVRDGCQLHHEDEDTHNDAIGNLEELTPDEHDARHYEYEDDF